MNVNIFKDFLQYIEIKILMYFPCITLVNVNAPVVATTSWWLHFSAPVVK